MPKKKKVVKITAAADGEGKPKPKKKRKVEPALDGGLSESDSSFRRSGRLSGKVLFILSEPLKFCFTKFVMLLNALGPRVQCEEWCRFRRR
jgi:hypothetical protein